MGALDGEWFAGKATAWGSLFCQDEQRWITITIGKLQRQRYAKIWSVSNPFLWFTEARASILQAPRFLVDAIISPPLTSNGSDGYLDALLLSIDATKRLKQIWNFQLEYFPVIAWFFSNHTFYLHAVTYQHISDISTSRAYGEADIPHSFHELQIAFSYWFLRL